MLETTRILSGDVVGAYVPVSVARLMLGVSRQRIYQLIDGGLLMAVKVQNTWLISRRSIEARSALLKQETERWRGGR